ncbi:MAG: S-methyl-5-thioribose-1-phosphate isomerase [Eubacteriaceae bacterium]|nr:S-methyl-5-thioribose-1-phosphate isomerase [Eubacteriaceae bacterium]
MTFIEPVMMGNDKLIILDQTLLPGEEHYLELDKAEDVCEAIRSLRVRGAPAIGVAAAIGIYACMRTAAIGTMADLFDEFAKKKKIIGSARPTAVNLAWALNKMEKCLESAAQEAAGSESGKVEYVLAKLREEAVRIREDDIAACRSMGEHGLTLLKPGMSILTHCNAGSLATAMYGTCLAPIYLGNEKGYDFHVYADETRPLLQGARLTAWELQKAGVDVTLICDNMASTLMQQRKIDAVVVGCDRMAANGDGANKIGTSAVAVLANYYEIPFYMFVPCSTIDLRTKTGRDIVIEERDGEEIYKMWYEKPMAPEGVKTYNPSFDVTPHTLITAVITERGIVKPPYQQGLRLIKERSNFGIFGGLREAIRSGIEV